MTETMIERAAREIYERRNGAGCKPWTLQTKAHKAPYFDDAKAAIKAMREPTQAMMDEGNSVDFMEAPSTYYCAMIDAALAEA